MPRERLLGLLVLADAALSIITVVANRTLDFLLPPALRTYLLGEGAQRGGPLLEAAWLGVVVATVLSWVGLINLVREARPLYLLSWVVYLGLGLLRGPAIQTPFEYAAQLLLALVGGIILGVVYFSDLRSRFRPLRDVREIGGAADQIAGTRG